MSRAVFQLALFMALGVSPCAVARADRGASDAVSNRDNWDSRLRAVPANATRTRHYYRVATREQLSGDAALSASGVTAGGGEGSDDPVYSCTPTITNSFLVVPGTSFYGPIADDITTVAVGGCDLEAFELVVGGGGDGSGPGFGFEFALYPKCPLDGVNPIPGTTGSLSFDDDGLHEVLIDLHDNPIPTNKSYYIGLSFDTNGSGWIAGVPATTGFTENQFHHPFIPCTAHFPSPSSYAGFYFVAHCGPTEREFVTYRSQNILGERLNLGDNNWIVDDIQLIGGIDNDTCILTSYDVAGVGTGTPLNPIPYTITAELRTSCEPASVIEGTQRTFDAVGDGLADVAQFVFPGGLELPPGRNLYVAFRYSAPALTIISGEPSLGFTQDTFTYEDGCDDGQGGQEPCAQCTFLSGNTVGFYASIRCQGEAPKGACCDPSLLSDEGDESEAELCSNVREIECRDFVSQFAPGAKCPGTCSDSYDRCQTHDDCPDGAYCILESPFDPPCGHFACCKPPFPAPQDEGCENMSKPDCLKMYDSFTCTDTTSTPAMACGGDGAPCAMDEDCQPGETCDPKTCFVDADCNACANSGNRCASDAECEPMEECVIGGDTCEPSDGAHQAVWQYGLECSDGQQDCRRWVCRFATGQCDVPHGSPGCSVPSCCEDVCDEDPFCCEVWWDNTCVQRAIGEIGHAQACNGIAYNDPCFVSRYCRDNSGLCDSDANCNECAESGFPCLENDDCRVCTNTGGPCQVDEDCTGGACVPSGEACMVSGVTCEESSAGARLLNTCSGACSDIVRACDQDSDCNHCSVNADIHCDNDDDCPVRQSCITTTACYVDNPLIPCQADNDCGDAGAKCIAQTSPLGVNMPVRWASSSPQQGETFCCHRSGPGSQAIGSVWAKFIATATSAQLSTCPSNAQHATDSIIEVYRTEFGKMCSDTGAPCAADQDCGSGVCTPSNRVACETRQPIACNDDALVGCTDSRNSELCVNNLEIGATYLVQVAAMTVSARDNYSLRLQSPCPGEIPTPPQSDRCEDAAMVMEGVWPYDLAGASMDCPYVWLDCLPWSGDYDNPYAMRNDVWFDYFVTESGLVTIQTCEGSPETTPDTTLVVYEGFDCPVTRQRQVVGGCNDDAGNECGSGSLVSFYVVANDSYRIRVGGQQGSEPSGMLTITVSPDCQPDGSVTFLNPDGAPDGDWYDARQPHQLDDATSLQGRSIFTVIAPTGADLGNGTCWELCQTNSNRALHLGLTPNSISAVNAVGDGMYDIVLAHPITQGEVTRLRYSATGDFAYFRYLPGDVNRDGTSAPADILAVIDCLNGVANFECSMSNTDVDRSDEAAPPDILRVIDLLNGAAFFEVWLDAQLDITGCE